MTSAINVVWFEQDLRIGDNPALTAAINQGEVLPIFILDNENAGGHALGGASSWWLHHSLTKLDEALQGKLNFYQGDSEAIIVDLCERLNIQSVCWNRRYEPWRISRDTKIKQQLSARGILATSFNAALLNEPWEILKKDDSPYKIFTPYHKQASAIEHDTPALPTPTQARHWQSDEQAIALDDLSLLPHIKWDSHFYTCWTPGELGAKSSLRQFLAHALDNYKDGRDFPALQAVSTLSPHLHFGEISPRQICEALKAVPNDDNREHFKRELRWREFSYYLLFHWPTLPSENLKTDFDPFPWAENSEHLSRWQQGLTGYPLIDAGMRELWQTGFMHNRVRMITASFLVKNLLIDWRVGARWFWDCLVDADLASNSASWQWVAGCGTDASPYFRIFNPITQGEKFDRHGKYTKRFLPELKNLPDKYLFKPWEAPKHVLEAANVTLGETYPRPIVDIKESRERALGAYDLIKQLRNG